MTTEGVVTVTDTGPGIATNLHGVVTQRFWRADQQRSDTAGLGLSIVRRIMQVHGGAFEVASAPGGGALFRLLFVVAERP